MNTSSTCSKRAFLPVISTIATLGLSTQLAFGTANYVYHERTGNNPGCGTVAYVPVLNPTAAQAYVLRFKIEFQNYTDNAVVYYTTDGSAPSGSFGVPSGTTVALPAAFSCTFGSSPLVDVWGATIPGQASGTRVRYIIGAWHSPQPGGGDEVFANSGACCPPYYNTSAQATVFEYTVDGLYWDSNGSTAGAGATPSGIWSTTDTVWSTLSE